MDKNNLKLLLAEKARLQANKSELTTNALKAIENETGLINSELEAVNGFISSLVEAGAAAQRKAQSKDTGAVSFVNFGVKVTHTIGKTVKWDQAELSAIAARIAGANEDPNNYMATTYKVSEKAYANWGDAIKKVFNKARTVKPGNPKIEFKEVK